MNAPQLHALVVATLHLIAVVAAHATTAKVTAVIDGDTIEVTAEQTTTRIRLHGIDAPETRQPFGARAKQELSERIFGRVVRVQTIDRDRYGRTVARIHLGDRDINVEMVAAGFAWWYRIYAPDDTALAEAEESARHARCGLWTDPDPLPPWTWRRPSRTLHAPRKPSDQHHFRLASATTRTKQDYSA